MLILLFLLLVFDFSLAKELSCQSLFSNEGIAQYIHFNAEYLDEKNNRHELEYWRKGKEKLRRLTDNKLDTYAYLGKDGNYTYFVIDKQRQIAVKISKAGLYRTGIFYDWNSLAHILRCDSKDSLKKLDKESIKLYGYMCEWYDLLKPSEAYRVCWSKQLGIPFLIERSQDNQARIIWKIKSLDTKPMDESFFNIKTGNLFRIDADEDIFPNGD